MCTPVGYYRRYHNGLQYIDPGDATLHSRSSLLKHHNSFALSATKLNRIAVNSETEMNSICTESPSAQFANATVLNGEQLQDYH
jgi:hypothetical protein